ncbi:hypothetical protein Neosp_001731 [[Neocosmospora] mangrovei]
MREASELPHLIGQDRIPESVSRSVSSESNDREWSAPEEADLHSEANQWHRPIDMNDNASSTGSDLPRFACDFCREKKIKCSKELPKDGEERQPQPTKVSEPIGVEDRLRRIENSLELLTNSVNQLLAASGSRPAPHPSSASNEKGNLAAATESERRPPDQIHTFSSLDEAARILQSFQDDSGPSLEHKQAQSSLQGLSDVLMNVSLHHGTADGAAPDSKFYIPTKETGYALMGQFLKHSELGDFMFLTPSDDILRQVLFEPQTVSAKAWVVFVNYMLLALATGSGQHADAATAFRKNMRLALDDAKIFLEPSVTSKLEHTAGVFLNLARERVNKHGSGSLASHGLQDNMAAPLPPIITNPGQAGFSFANAEDSQQTPSLGDIDIEAFMQWLPPNIPMQSTADVDMEEELEEAASSQETRGLKRSIDSTFDWFSWDTYYASGTIL